MLQLVDPAPQVPTKMRQHLRPDLLLRRQAVLTKMMRLLWPQHQ
jgi:hypothetical protein